MSLTLDQIDKRLQALFDYEMSLHRNTWDDPDRVSDELLKVISARSKLHEMRKALNTAGEGEI